MLEELNVIKLALMLAIERNWSELTVQGTNHRSMQQLSLKEFKDWRSANALENVIYLSSLFSYCLFQVI